MEQATIWHIASSGDFLAKIQEITHDLKGIEVLIDDILIYGCEENMEEALKNHNRNLERLLIRLKEKGYKLNKDKLNLFNEIYSKIQ